MFVCLLSAALCGSGRFTALTKSSFKRFVEKRPRDEVWVVMFHTSSNFNSKKIYPKFLNASKLAGGMFRFGVIDTKKEPLLTRQFMPKEIPTILVFSANGQSEYIGTGEPDDIIAFAAQYLNDQSVVIDASWLTEAKKARAILFTQKQETPMLWVGISHVFHKKPVSVGICRDETLAKSFGVTEFPTILFVNSTCKYKYVGAIEFTGVARDLSKFIDKTLKTDDNSAADEIYPASEFEEKCLGGTRICVIDTNENDESFNEIHKRFRKAKFLWFRGPGLEWDFVKENEIWIYNPKLDSLIQVSHHTLLADVLKNIDTATSEWRNRKDFLNEEL